jgi:hypothetical protein
MVLDLVVCRNHARVTMRLLMYPSKMACFLVAVFFHTFQGCRMKLLIPHPDSKGFRIQGNGRNYRPAAVTRLTLCFAC